MKIRLRTVLKTAAVMLMLLLIAGLAAPYLTANQYRGRLEGAIERALGRRVELGRVSFSLFKRSRIFRGPGDHPRRPRHRPGADRLRAGSGQHDGARRASGRCWAAAS